MAPHGRDRPTSCRRRRVPWRLIALVAARCAPRRRRAGDLRRARAPRVPAPFGPAANGVDRLSVTPHGDIMAANPATGALDHAPRRFVRGHRPDGSRMTAGGSPSIGGPTAWTEALFLANADGSDVHQFVGSGRGDPRGSTGRLTIRGSSSRERTTRMAPSRSSMPRTAPKRQLDARPGRPAGDLAPGQRSADRDRRTHGPRRSHARRSTASGQTGPASSRSWSRRSRSTSPPCHRMGRRSRTQAGIRGAEGRIHVLDIDTGTETGVDFDAGVRLHGPQPGVLAGRGTAPRPQVRCRSGID